MKPQGKCFVTVWVQGIVHKVNYDVLLSSDRTSSCTVIDETTPAYFQLNIFHKEAREGQSEIALCAKILKKTIISCIFHYYNYNPNLKL